MLQVVLLQLAVVEWETRNKSAFNSDSWKKWISVLLVVKEVVRHVIANVSKDTATVGCYRSVPVPEDDCVREFPVRYGKGHEHCRRHHQS